MFRIIILPKTTIKRYKRSGFSLEKPPPLDRNRGSLPLETQSLISTFEDSIFVEPEAIDTPIESVPIVLDPEEISFEIGAWLSGIRAFARSHQLDFGTNGAQSTSNLNRESRIVQLGVRKVLSLCLRLRRASVAESALGYTGLTLRDLDALTSVLRAAAAQARAYSSSNDVTFAAWSGWTGTLLGSLDSDKADGRFRQYSNESAYATLPGGLRELFDRDDILVADRADYGSIVPRVATSLRYLEIVARMMRNDEPLKPALLVLSAVYLQSRALIEHMNLRLERFENQEKLLFSSLDSASYSASLENKKVFKQELRGMIGVLPPTSVFARIETAYSLLLDSFQQILLDLVRTIEPKATLFDFFPRFQIKLDQSLILREHLWQILKAVRTAEDSPEKANVDNLRQELADFMTITIRFLHYKDEETFERFNEEVFAAVEKKDLVPVLHRFGAYLETLFGQVCMRAVLADHPFQHGN